LKPWRIWIFGITLFIAGFTPSADPLSMLLLAVPLISLYFMAGGIALLNDRRRAKRFSVSEGGEGAISAPAKIEPAAPIDSTDF
jgi:sec-independent protein translocase protein TatC